MYFTEVNEDKKNAIMPFVRANGSFLQDWDWGDFQKTRGKRIVRYALAENGPAASEKIIFYGQGIIEKTGSRLYIYFPYGPIAAPEIDYAECLRIFAAELKNKYKNLIFLRIEPKNALKVPDPQIAASNNLNPHQTLLLDISQGDEKLLAGMHPKTRYNIKVAQKHGVEVKVLQELPRGDNIFLQTARRAGIRGFPDDYYKQIVGYFSTDKNIKASLYAAFHGQDMLAANIILWWNKTAVYLFGGSASGEKRNMMAPYLLQWQAIKDARAAGMEKYDFWGVETDPKHPWHGFSRFKLGFGGDVIQYQGTHDFIYQRAWYNVYTILRKVNRAIKK